MLELPADFEFDIDDIPENAKARNLELVFQVQLGEKRVKRVGFSHSQEAARAGEVMWIPIPNTISILKVYMGDYEATRGMELMNERYLVVAVPQKGKTAYKGKGWAAPKGQLFALDWE